MRRIWNIRQVHRITWSRFDEVSLGSSSEGEVKIWMLTSHDAKKYFLKENSYTYAHVFCTTYWCHGKMKMLEDILKRWIEMKLHLHKLFQLTSYRAEHSILLSLGEQYPLVCTTMGSNPKRSCLLNLKFSKISWNVLLSRSRTKALERLLGWI